MRPPRKGDYSPGEERILQGFTISKVSGVLKFADALVLLMFGAGFKYLSLSRDTAPE